MRRLCTAVLVVIGAVLVPATSATAATTCSGTMSGTITGDVTVPAAGYCILDNANVTGGVTVNSAAFFEARNGTVISKGVTGKSADSVRLLDTSYVGGDVNANKTGASGNDPAVSVLCGTVKGAVTVTKNANPSGNGSYWRIGGYAGAPTDGCTQPTFDVGGRITYENNAGKGAEIEHTRSSKLLCSGNTETIYASDNTRPKGQCLNTP